MRGAIFLSLRLRPRLLLALLPRSRGGLLAGGRVRVIDIAYLGHPQIL